MSNENPSFIESLVQLSDAMDAVQKTDFAKNSQEFQKVIKEQLSEQLENFQKEASEFKSRLDKIIESTKQPYK